MADEYLQLGYLTLHVITLIEESRVTKMQGMYAEQIVLVIIISELKIEVPVATF